MHVLPHVLFSDKTAPLGTAPLHLPSTSPTDGDVDNPGAHVIDQTAQGEDALTQHDDAWWQETAAEASDGIRAEDSPADTKALNAAPAPNYGTAPLPQLPSSQDVAHNQSFHPAARGLAVAALRDIGRVRSINQDSVFAQLTTVPREGADMTVGIFVVADGMGGHEGGEIASRLAVSTVARELWANLILPALEDGAIDSLQTLMVEAVQAANRTIWNQSQLMSSDMGTTCTVALLLGHAVYIAHVGDSRAYLSSPEGMTCLTIDHSAVGRLIQVGQLDPSEAREHPLRSQLYRTVGQMPEIQVDYYYHQLGDASHLLLCSDGLWGLIDESELQAIFQQYVWPHDICAVLVQRANDAGGDDNISAVVVALPPGSQQGHTSS
jgi:serine/threonine protein phosphatase PrpC